MKALLIAAAVLLGVCAVVQLLASPAAGEWLGFYRAYESLPTGVVADLARNYEKTANTYDQLAATADAEAFDTDAMRALAGQERSKARAAQLELAVRWVGRGAFAIGSLLLAVAGIMFWKTRRRMKAATEAA